MWNNEGYAWGIAKIRNWGMIVYIILRRAWELMTKGSNGEGVNAQAKVWAIANAQGNMGGNLQHWSVGFRLRWLGDKGAMVKGVSALAEVWGIANANGAMLGLLATIGLLGLGCWVCTKERGKGTGTGVGVLQLENLVPWDNCKQMSENRSHSPTMNWTNFYTWQSYPKRSPNWGYWAQLALKLGMRSRVKMKTEHRNPYKKEKENRHLQKGDPTAFLTWIGFGFAFLKLITQSFVTIELR